MDTLIEFTSIQNPKGLSWNYFLHHWGIYSVSLFVNAVMFTSGEDGSGIPVPDITVDSVTVSVAPEPNGTIPEFVQLGGKQRFIATSTGTVTPATAGVDVPNGVVWTISATGGVPLRQGTFIDVEGVLHVAENENNKQVTITATNMYIDPTKPMNEQEFKSGSIAIGIGAAIVDDGGNDDGGNDDGGGDDTNSED